MYIPDFHNEGMITKKTVSSRGGYRLSYCWFSEESGNSRQFAATSHKSKSCDSRAEQNQGIPTIGNLVGSDNRSPLFIASFSRQAWIIGGVVDAVQVVEPEVVFSILDGFIEGGGRHVQDQVGDATSTVGLRIHI